MILRQPVSVLKRVKSKDWSILLKLQSSLAPVFILNSTCLSARTTATKSPLTKFDSAVYIRIESSKVFGRTWNLILIFDGLGVLKIIQKLTQVAKQTIIKIINLYAAKLFRLKAKLCSFICSIY